MGPDPPGARDPSTGSFWTHHAPGWVRYGAARKPGGGAPPPTWTSWCRCRNDCSPRHSTRCGQGEWSATRRAHRSSPRRPTWCLRCSPNVPTYTSRTPGRCSPRCRRRTTVRCRAPSSCGRTGTPPTRCSSRCCARPDHAVQGDALQAPVHHVQPDEALCRVVERLRDGANDRETERLPQTDRSGVRLDHGVELHAVEPCRARPVDGVLPEATTDSATCMCRVHHEARCRHVGSTPGTVRAHLGRAQHRVTLKSHHGLSGRLLHPERPTCLPVEILGVGVRLTGGHDLGEERPDVQPVLVPGSSDHHGGESTVLRPDGANRIASYILCHIPHMADTITFRPDEDAARALAALTRDGTPVSTAVRSALIAAARERARAALRVEAEALAADEQDRAEAAQVLRDMESLRAW